MIILIIFLKLSDLNDKRIKIIDTFRDLQNSYIEYEIRKTVGQRTVETANGDKELPPNQWIEKHVSYGGGNASIKITN